MEWSDWMPKALALLGVLNAPVYLLLGRWVFGTMERFVECVVYFFTPDLYSWINGELEQDVRARLQLLFFFLCCAGCLLFEVVLFAPLLSRHLGS